MAAVAAAATLVVAVAVVGLPQLAAETADAEPALGKLVEARLAQRGDDLFLSSVQLSRSEFQTMLIRRVSVTRRDVTIELGGAGGGCAYLFDEATLGTAPWPCRPSGWNASEQWVRLVLPRDHLIRVRPR